MGFGPLDLNLMAAGGRDGRAAAQGCRRRDLRCGLAGPGRKRPFGLHFGRGKDGEQERTTENAIWGLVWAMASGRERSAAAHRSLALASYCGGDIARERGGKGMRGSSPRQRSLGRLVRRSAAVEWLDGGGSELDELQWRRD